MQLRTLPKRVLERSRIWARQTYQRYRFHAYNLTTRATNPALQWIGNDRIGSNQGINTLFSMSEKSPPPTTTSDSSCPRLTQAPSLENLPDLYSLTDGTLFQGSFNDQELIFSYQCGRAMLTLQRYGLPAMTGILSLAFMGFGIAEIGIPNNKAITMIILGTLGSLLSIGITPISKTLWPDPYTPDFGKILRKLTPTQSVSILRQLPPRARNRILAAIYLSEPQYYKNLSQTLNNLE